MLFRLFLGFFGEIEGVDEYSDDSQDDVMTLLEMHVYDLFEGIDGQEMDSDEADENAVAIPYVITIDYENQRTMCSFAGNITLKIL